MRWPEQLIEIGGLVLFGANIMDEKRKMVEMARIFENDWWFNEKVMVLRERRLW